MVSREVRFLRLVFKHFNETLLSEFRFFFRGLTGEAESFLRVDLRPRRAHLPALPHPSFRSSIVYLLPKQPYFPQFSSFPSLPYTSTRISSQKAMTSTPPSRLMDPSSPPFHPPDPTGHSNGILASHNILAGTVLPGEHYLFRIPWEQAFPLMSTSDGPRKFLDGLSYDQLQVFTAIPPVPPSADPGGTIGSHLIMSRLLKFTPIVVNKGHTIALFLLPRAKVRHSCVPNARLLVHTDGTNIFGE